jgi:site-specific DNA recombinase
MVEEVIIRYLYLYGKDVLKPPTRKGIDVSALRAEAKRLRERKTAQIRMHALGDLSDDELTTGMRTIRDRLSVVEAQIHASSEADPLAEFRNKAAEAVWNSLSLPRKRAIVRLLLDITFLPTSRRGPGFDRGSIKIEWRS